MQKQLQSFMQKEMSRKEFMATLGFGAATVMGFGTLLKLAGVHPAASASPPGKRQAGYGYGSSSYGGRRES